MAKRLDRIIHENCHQKLPSEECKKRAIGYIRSQQSASNLDIVFLEELMKVAVNILNSDKCSLDGLLEKVFKFGKEGIEKIEKEKREKSSDKKYEKYLSNLLPLQAHLYSYIGDVSMFLFWKTKNIEDVKNWYNGKRASADLMCEVNPKYSTYAYSFAAKAAKAWYDATGDISCAEKGYECEMLSAYLAAEFNPKHAAHSNGLAGDWAYELINSVKKGLLKEEGAGEWAREWAKIGVECYNSLLNYYKTKEDESMRGLVYAIKRKRHFLKTFLEQKLTSKISIQTSPNL